MKLDDRPVIDQLLNPTPLNHLHEVLSEVCDKVYDGQDSLESLITESLSVLDPIIEDHMGKEGQREANDALFTIIGDMAAYESDRQLANLRAFASELEARL